MQWQTVLIYIKSVYIECCATGKLGKLCTFKIDQNRLACLPSQIGKYEDHFISSHLALSFSPSLLQVLLIIFHQMHMLLYRLGSCID